MDKNIASQPSPSHVLLEEYLIFEDPQISIMQVIPQDFLLILLEYHHSDDEEHIYVQ